MRCPDCNKFASLETQEPEADLDLEVQEDNKHANITGTVRVVRACQDCSTEMKETTFDVDASIELSGINEDAEVENATVEVTSIEATESGGGRYKKNMIGYKLDYVVSVPWKLGKKEGEEQIEGSLEDSVSASSFDEMI